MGLTIQSSDLSEMTLSEQMFMPDKDATLDGHKEVMIGNTTLKLKVWKQYNSI